MYSRSVHALTLLESREEKGARTINDIGRMHGLLAGG